jgi:acetylornithine aminotransferase
VRRVPPAFYSDLAALCREKNWLLLFDEVQTGMGRTGTLFAFQNPAVVPADARPDALSMAKGLANGLPIGGVIARPEIADLLHPGDHATTFGGGAVPCRAALAVLKELSPARLAQARKLGALFQKEISGWQKDLPALREVRGAGLMIGLELDRPVADLVVACREAGLLINGTADKVLRLLPPLILTAADARRGLKILRTVLAKSLSSQSH